MSKNISILLTLIIVFITSYFLYWKGELTLQKEAENFSVLAFENTILDCDKDSFDFFIENNRTEKTSYQVLITADQKPLENLTVLIPAQTKKSISIKEEIIENLCNRLSNFEYKVTINDHSSNLDIYKLISL